MTDIKTAISFSYKRRRVLIHKTTLRSIGMPSNIRFLLNMKKKLVAVQKCEAIDRDSFKVPDNINDANFTYEITSLNFIKMIYKMAGWDVNLTYRIAGECFEENRLVEFATDEAVVISDEEFVDEEYSGFKGV